MDPWPFVIAAYVVALGGTAALFGASYWRMRRTERAAQQLGRRP